MGSVAKYLGVGFWFWVIGLHNLLAMSLMALGNWSQHIFVDPQDSRNNYRLTYNCIDNPANRTTFNDGYHVIHHLNARPPVRVFPPLPPPPPPPPAVIRSCLSRLPRGGRVA